jgi:hypothetical protein
VPSRNDGRRRLKTSALLPAAIENRVPPRFNFLLDGDLGWLEIARGARLQLEMMIGVATANEHRAVVGAGHLSNARYLPTFVDLDGDFLAARQLVVVPCRRARSRAVACAWRQAADVVLRPGQMSLHDGKIIHGSHANRTDDRRIGFAICRVATAANQAVTTSLGSRPQ